MQEFVFPSAGLIVVFRGDDLFLRPETLAEFEDKYVGRVSERTIQRMLVVAQNVEALRERAKANGTAATFHTWTTYLSSEELKERWKEVLRNSHVYMRRVCKLTGGCLTWVVERGKKGGRLHGHFVLDRWLSVEQQWKAKQWRNSLMGRCHVCALTAGRYILKEMAKGVGRVGTGMRLMGSNGDFKGRCVMKDFLLDSPMAECRRRAWRTKGRWETQGEVWQRGKELYNAWLAGKLDLGPVYDKLRSTIGGGGDAYEASGGSEDFNVEDFQ